MAVWNLFHYLFAFIILTIRIYTWDNFANDFKEYTNPIYWFSLVMVDGPMNTELLNHTCM